MSHIFDPKKFAKLDSPERRKKLPATEVIKLLKLPPGSRIADVGCGVGYFAFPFAQEGHTVFAIDTSEIMIEELKRRIQSENISPLLGPFKDHLKVASIDVFFTSTLIHELDDLESFSNEAVSTLSEGGQLVHLDFDTKNDTMGPPLHKRVPSQKVIDLFNALGLKDITHHAINDVFYMVTGVKG